MKKVIISSAVALTLGFATLASSAFASYTFSNYLTVGSTGADVTALQSWLVSNGFLTMPAGVSMGYFGSLTKAAVIAYQASVGLPNTGFVGPLTVAKLNASQGTAMASCPAGYTCTPPVTTSFTCPVGWTCTPPATTSTTTTVNQNLTAITTPGVAGTLNIAKGTFVGNGVTVNDGQAVDVASFDLQAGASDMAVSSLNFDFDVRPWLYITSLSVYNAATGATLATVSGLTQSNFTELTVGDDYRLTVPGISLVVPAGKKITIVLHAQFATSNRDSTNIHVSRAEVRAVDGTNVTTTESVGSPTSSDWTGGLGLYVAYAGKNSSNLIVTIDPSSPNTGIIQTNTGTTQTQNVLLGIFDIKSQNIDATLQGLTVNLNMSGIGSVGSVFSNVQLKTGSTLLTSGSISSSTASTSAVVFSNFNLPLPSNTYVPVSVYVNILGGVNGVSASTSLQLLSANFSGIDSSSNALTLSGSGTLPSANQTFILSGVDLSNLAWSIAAPGIVSNSTAKTTTFSGSFTVTAGSNPVYLSTTAATALTLETNATTTGGVVASFSNFVPSNGIQSYDVAGTDYQITPGSSRTFTVNGTVTNGAGVSQSIAAGISAINFSTTAAGVGSPNLPITFLLQGLNSDNHIQVLAGTN